MKSFCLQTLFAANSLFADENLSLLKRKYREHFPGVTFTGTCSGGTVWPTIIILCPWKFCFLSWVMVTWNDGFDNEHTWP